MNTKTDSDIAVDSAINLIPATADGAMPSIKAPEGVKIIVTMDDETRIQRIVANPYNTIQTLICDHEEWLNGVHQTANEKLYELLGRCYGIYKLMCDDKSSNKKFGEALKEHIKSKGLSINAGAHTLNKIVKVVFGADRRRASAYYLALKVALDQGVKAADIPKFFRDAGGVEEVRRVQANGGKPSIDKVAVAKQHLPDNVLAVINVPAITKQLDQANLDKQVILIATTDVGGALNINAVVQTESVVNSALTAIYNEKQKDWSESSTQKDAASAAEQKADLMEQAIAEAASQPAVAA